MQYHMYLEYSHLARFTAFIMIYQHMPTSTCLQEEFGGMSPVACTPRHQFQDTLAAGEQGMESHTHGQPRICISQHL